MNAVQITLLVLIPPLLVASAFCSSAETALFSLGHKERGRLQRMSPGAAAAATRLLANPRAVLISVLVLNSVVSVLYFVVTSVLARESGSDVLGVAVSVGSLLALVVLGEILPKLLARRDPALWARGLVRPFFWCYRLLAPVRRLLDFGMVAPLTRLVRPQAAGPRAITVEELADLLEVSAREGELEPGEEELLSEVVELGTIRVREVMTPRVEVPFLERADPPARLEEIIASTGRRLVPLLSAPEGRVLGFVDAKRFLALREAEPARSSEARYDQWLVAPLFVPEGARLDQLIEEFRRAGQETALCVDEHGAVVGLVTLGDVVRRIVGGSEEDAAGLAGGVERAGEGKWIVPGRLRLGELRSLLDRETSREAAARGVTTVAGLVLVALGRLPRVGERVEIQNLILEVQGMRGRRIDRVALSVADGGHGPEGGGA